MPRKRDESTPAAQQRYERELREWAHWQHHQARLRRLATKALGTLEAQLESGDPDKAMKAATTLLQLAGSHSAAVRNKPSYTSLIYANVSDQAEAAGIERAMFEAEQEALKATKEATK